MSVTPLERNIRLYPWFRMAADCMGWIPVFFLYMNSVLPVGDVIQLSALYYLAVFTLEVPSGYFSDRFGRRVTLLLAAGSLVLAYTLFILGGSFAVFAMAQILLASGIAMQSGTDTAFHYDSLSALGREAEYAEREAKAEQRGLLSLALATLGGGALAVVDLRLAYALSLCGALAMLALVWRFNEPVHAGQADERQSFAVVLISCLARLRDPVLAWLFAILVIFYAMAHIVFEFYQPYIALLDLDSLSAGRWDPLVSGLVISVSMFGGAIGARVGIAWQRSLGLVGLLAVGMVIQLGIVGAMAALVHGSVLLLVSARNFPMSLIHAPVHATIAPRIATRQRATYLSLQGLTDRVVFATLLMFLSSGLPDTGEVSQALLSGILVEALWIGGLPAVILFILYTRIHHILRSAS